jgi:transcription antitermination factor NusG
MWFEVLKPSGCRAATPPGAESNRHWYALYTYSNQEKRAAQQLQMKGVEVFLPLSRVTKRWRNRMTVHLERPLFAGYVFAKLALTERVRVLEVPNVVRIVGSGKQPLPLPDAELETLRNGLHLRHVDPCPYLQVGQRARIHSGPLAGMEGIVARKDDRLRIVLSLDLIAQSIAVHVHPDELEPCG